MRIPANGPGQFGINAAPPADFQVMYGGRAIDSFDRRILTIYMNEYLGDFIFDTFQPFHFFHNDEVDYRIPEGNTKDMFVGKQKLFASYF